MQRPRQGKTRNKYTGGTVIELSLFHLFFFFSSVYPVYLLLFIVLFLFAFVGEDKIGAQNISRNFSLKRFHSNFIEFQFRFFFFSLTAGHSNIVDRF